VLKVEDLFVEFRIPDGKKEALCGVSFSVYEGEVYCLLGESGSGKTALLKAIMGLLPPNASCRGRIIFDGVDLLALPPEEIRKYRGRKIAMVFQEPLTALNPTMQVGRQVAEVLEVHFGVGEREAKERVVELFRDLGIPDPEQRYHHYPHSFSGGMRQRVVIAMALVADPRLILADEPTTALDVTVQAQILRLLREAVEKRGASMIFVTHDISVAAEIGDRVGILYRGYMVEEGSVEEVLSNPLHPYTLSLIEALPLPGKPVKAVASEDRELPAGGCPYYGRCQDAEKRCRDVLPELVDVCKGHRVRCLKKVGRA